VTAVLNDMGYEITTLRKDIETDGRHAVVAFGTDFEHDAKRRDFTINALYVDRSGVVYDYVDGLSDVETMNLRFIGDAGERIQEDYLRILRFFRFFAWFGKHRPDAEGLKASMRHKEGIKSLSAERIWAEMHKLFSAPDPSRALLWMRQVGVLTLLLPESEKWGIDAIPALMEAERNNEWSVDPLIRLMAIVPKRQNSVNDIATRWRLSNAQRDRMRAWAALPSQLPKDDVALRALAYRHSKQALIDGLYVQTAMQRDDDLASFAKSIEAWKLPEMPIKGADLLERGYEKGPNLGGKLKQIEEIWISSDFSLDRDALLSQI
ncbi:MAG: CCA tRNA nucleotidyltransferase, partial [Pseudomonadota bacterium]